MMRREQRPGPSLEPGAPRRWHSRGSSPQLGDLGSRPSRPAQSILESRQHVKRILSKQEDQILYAAPKALLFPNPNIHHQSYPAGEEVGSTGVESLDSHSDSPEFEPQFYYPHAVIPGEPPNLSNINFLLCPTKFCFYPQNISDAKCDTQQFSADTNRVSMSQLNSDTTRSYKSYSSRVHPIRLSPTSDANCKVWVA